MQIALNTEGGSFDPAASAYFAYAGNLSPAEKAAVNAWFLEVKPTTVWTGNKLDRVYFMVGGTAVTCSKNALADSGHLGYVGEVATFSSSGIKGIITGLGFYATTGWIPSVSRSINSVHGYVYVNLAPTNENGAFYSSLNAANTARMMLYENGGFVGTHGINNAVDTGVPFIGPVTVSGGFGNTRTGATAQKIYGGGTNAADTAVSTLVCPVEVTMFARFDQSTNDRFSDCRMAGATFGGAITDAEFAILDTAFINLNTALGRLP